MAWTAPQTWTTGQVVTAADMNTDIRDNMLALSGHSHTGAGGEGGTSLGPLVRVDFTDASAPAAPGAGKTRIYTVAGKLRSRAGASGVDTQIVSAADFTDEGEVPYFDGTDVAPLAPGTVGQFLQTQGVGSPPQWSNITTVDVIDEQGGGFTFASIPATFRHLVIKVRANSSIAGPTPAFLTFNGDAGANYAYTYWSYVGPHVGQTTSTAQSAGFVGNYAIGSPLDMEIMINHYIEAQSVRWTAIANNGLGLNLIVGEWSGPGPIGSIAINGSFGAGSIATLYGFPAA